MFSIKHTLVLALSCSLFFVACQQETPNPPLIIDTHNDILHNQFRVGTPRPFTLPGWSAFNGESLVFPIEEANAGNMAAQVFSVFVNSDEKPDQFFELAVAQIDTLEAWVNRNSEQAVFVKQPADLENAIQDGKFAAMFGVEGGHVIEDDPEKLAYLAKRGMSYLTITWNNSTSWATSAADEVIRPDSMDFLGLNERGIKYIQQMNELGVMVDVSHAGEQTFWDIVEHSTNPIIASHSCVWELTPSRRNLKDEQIDAIAASGGVIFVNFYSGFIDSTYNDRYAEYMSEFGDEIDSLVQNYNDSWYGEIEHFAKNPVFRDALRPPLSALVHHIDYIVQRVGIDHVGLGADFEGAESFPIGINGMSDYPILMEALRLKGYSQQDLEKIGYKNFIRVWKENRL